MISDFHLSPPSLPSFPGARDGHSDVWTIHCESVLIDSAAKLTEWSKQLTQELGKLRGKKAYLFVDLKAFELDPAYSEQYGKVAKEVVTNHAISLVRYGMPGGLTKAAVRTAAIRNHFPSNIFADREAALEALHRIRQLPAA